MYVCMDVCTITQDTTIMFCTVNDRRIFLDISFLKKCQKGISKHNVYDAPSSAVVNIFCLILACECHLFMHDSIRGQL